MPFQAAPMTFVCAKCGWQKTTLPLSDVINVARNCPKCGEGSLTHRLASKTETLMAKLGSLLARSQSGPAAVESNDVRLAASASHCTHVHESNRIANITTTPKLMPANAIVPASMIRNERKAAVM